MPTNIFPFDDNMWTGDRKSLPFIFPKNSTSILSITRARLKQQKNVNLVKTLL